MRTFGRPSGLIQRLHSEAGRVPAFAYVAAYLLLILAFSLIYFAYLTASPARHFHFSTDPSQYMILNREDEVVRDLRSELIQDYRSNGQADQAAGGWRMLTDDLEVSSLYTGNLPAMFSFQLLIPVVPAAGGNADSWGYVKGTVTVYTDGRFISSDIAYLPFRIDQVQDPYAAEAPGMPTQIPTPGMHPTYELNEIWGAALQPSAGPAAGTPQPVAGPELLPLSLGLFDRITAMGAAGAPSPRSGYLQMLYFSAGIATSNAPADILPISAEARATAMAEAILAVVLVGLFLNSLAYGVGESLHAARGFAPESSQPAPAAAKRKDRAPRPAAPKPGKTGAAAQRGRTRSRSRRG